MRPAEGVQREHCPVCRLRVSLCTDMHIKEKSRAFVNVIVDIRFESINTCTVQKAVVRIP